MAVPLLVIAVIIRVTPILVRLIVSHAVKAAMKNIAKKWPQIKTAIESGQKIQSVATEASDTKSKADAYFLQAEVVNNIREDIAAKEIQYDYLVKNAAQLQKIIDTTTSTKTRNDTPDFTQEFKDMKFKNINTWTNLGYSYGSESRSGLAYGFFTDRCGSGAEQFYHIETGKGTARNC